MSILCIGDPHFMTSNKNESTEMCNEIIKYVSEVHKTNQDKIKYIVILGDVLHTHEKINMSCLTDACKFIETLCNFYHVYILIGNHDRINEKDFLTDYHPFYPYHSHEKITIVDKPLISENSLFVPYVEPGRFVEAIQTKYKLDQVKNCDFVFAHQEFKGCVMNSIVSKVGDEWPDDYPPVITGHIHSYQRLGKNILYIGTPIQHNYNCSDNKGISLIDKADTNSLYPYQETRITLDVTKKITIRISYQQLMNMKDSLHRRVDKVMRKLVISGNDAELKLLRNNKLYNTLKNQYDKIELKCDNSKVFDASKSDTKLDTTSNQDFISYVLKELNNDEQKLFNKIHRQAE